MIALIYPEGDFAPVIPSRKAEDVDILFGRVEREKPKVVEGKEWLPVIQEDGTVIGMSTRAYCHSGSGVLHPVVHLHILDRSGRVPATPRWRSRRVSTGM